MTSPHELVKELEVGERILRAHPSEWYRGADHLAAARSLIERLYSGEGVELETDGWERDQWRFGVNPFSKEDRERLLRDFNRMIVRSLNAEVLLAAERERSDRLVGDLRAARAAFKGEM